MFHIFLLKSRKNYKNAQNIQKLNTELNKRSEKFTELCAPLSIEQEKTATNSYANRKRSAIFSGWHCSFINSVEEPELSVFQCRFIYSSIVFCFSSALLLAIFFLHSSKDALSTCANKRPIANESSFFFAIIFLAVAVERPDESCNACKNPVFFRKHCFYYSIHLEIVPSSFSFVVRAFLVSHTN